MASPGQTISSDALRAFRHYHFVRVWGKEVFLLIYKHLFLSGQPKTIREILEDNGIPFPPDISPKKCYFNGQEIPNLSGKPEDLDITLMNKVCRALWNKGVSDPGDKLKDLIKKIKDERNAVCHEEGNNIQTVLEHKVNGFQTTLEEILDEARSLRPHNGVKIDQQKIDLLKTELKDVVPNLLEKIREKYDPSVQNELQKLQLEIKDFWYQLYDYILQLIQDELKPLYKRHCKICFYDWLAQYGVTDPCGTTVSLKMDREKEFHRCHKSQGSISVDQKELLDIKDPNGKDPKAVIISGCAGAGKSTIMCSILEKWHKGTRDMPKLLSFQILLYMPFRNHSVDNFDEFLKRWLPKTLGLFDLEHVKSAIMSSKCLILCDGYDEANDSSRKLFEELINLNFQDRKVVVTTRPGSAARLTKIINNAKHDRINLSLLGFQDEDMKSLLGKITPYLIKDDVTRMEEMKRELIQVIDNIDETTKDILETPLYFNLFILLYLECPEIRERLRNEKISSASTLYIHFEEHKKERIIEKTGIQREFLKEFDELYLKYSIQNYKGEKYELSETEIDDMKSQIQCKGVTDNFDSLLSSYFNIKHSIEGLKITKVFTYRHASELEFAAARKISEDIIKSCSTKTGNIVESVLVSNGIWQMWQEKSQTKQIYASQIPLLTPIIGILYSHKKNVFYSLINDLYNSLLMFAVDNFDFLLDICIETNLGPKVIESLSLVLENNSAVKKLIIKKAGSVLVLPQLLPRLEPECVEIKHDCDICFYETLFDVDFQSLKKSAEVARHHRVPVHLELCVHLKKFVEMSVGDSSPVDKLDLNIYDNEVNLNKLRPFPISSTNLSVVYECGQRRDILEVSRIINAVWPRRQRRDSETESKEEISSCHSSSKEKNHEFQLPSLRIIRIIEEDEIRPLIESLTVLPLRELILPKCYVSSQEIRTELSNECREKGVGELIFGTEEAVEEARFLEYITAKIII